MTAREKVGEREKGKGIAPDGAATKKGKSAEAPQDGQEAVKSPRL